MILLNKFILRNACGDEFCVAKFIIGSINLILPCYDSGVILENKFNEFYYNYARDDIKSVSFISEVDTREIRKYNRFSRGMIKYRSGKYGYIHCIIGNKSCAYSLRPYSSLSMGNSSSHSPLIPLSILIARKTYRVLPTNMQRRNLPTRTATDAWRFLPRIPRIPKFIF